MSEPIRYDFEQAELNKSAGFYVRKEGHWVRWDDHATALQEIQRLKAEVEELTHDANEADQQYEHAISRVRRLEADVERLRKAGDELSWAFAFAVSRDDGKESGLIKAWNAAKEGKQS